MQYVNKQLNVGKKYQNSQCYHGDLHPSCNPPNTIMILEAKKLKCFL